MAVKKMALANRWMSVTDVIDRLRRARENREQQSRLLEGLEGRAKQRRDDVERSLTDLSVGQRNQVVTRAVNGYRSELKRQSLDSRVAYLKTFGALREDVNSARAHYQSPVQMLACEGLGSERRSRLLHQIEKSGQIELASLAALAASTGDKELAAALLTRNSGMSVNNRAFSSQELADALVGDEWRKVNQAIAEVDRIAVEAVHADSAFETGKPNATRAVNIALMRRDEQAMGADLTDLAPSIERDEHGLLCRNRRFVGSLQCLRCGFERQDRARGESLERAGKPDRLVPSARACVDAHGTGGRSFVAMAICGAEERRLGGGVAGDPARARRLQGDAGQERSQRRAGDRAIDAAGLVPPGSLQVDTGAGSARAADGAQAGSVEAVRH